MYFHEKSSFRCSLSLILNLVLSLSLAFSLSLSRPLLFFRSLVLSFSIPLSPSLPLPPSLSLPPPLPLPPSLSLCLCSLEERWLHKQALLSSLCSPAAARPLSFSLFSSMLSCILSPSLFSFSLSLLSRGSVFLSPCHPLRILMAFRPLLPLYWMKALISGFRVIPVHRHFRPHLCPL